MAILSLPDKVTRMAILELCGHLRLLSEKLAPISSDDSYRVGRLWQNLRLDMPCIQNNVSRKFADGEEYPFEYPLSRGANVSTSREKKFVRRIETDLPNLSKIVDRAKSGQDIDVLAATSDFFRRIELAWGDEEFLTTRDICNNNNCAPSGSVPILFSRYIDFRSFVAYALLPNSNPTKWGLDQVKEFLDHLGAEKNRPGKYWKELASIWKDVSDKIKNGSLSFKIPPRFCRGDVKFVGDGSAPIHLSSLAPLKSPDRIHYVVKHLALPGWESPKHREKKLGMVALVTKSDGLQPYRPTILDNFGAYSYFFLPSMINSSSGMTWKLTDDLMRNSTSDHSGLAEWTAIVQKPGIDCAISVGGGHQPAFDLVGLEFGLEHASLFEI